MQHAEASAQAAARFAGDARTVLFMYESGFTETEASFDILARAMGGTLTPAQRQDLFAAFTRDKIEEKISRLPVLPSAWRNPATDDLLDRDTQWHRHHAGRSGESGRWRRMLAPQDVAVIEQRMANFLQTFGYQGEKP